MLNGSQTANAGGAGVMTSPPVPPQWPGRAAGYSPEMVPPAPQPVVQQNVTTQPGQPVANQPYGQAPASYNQPPQQPNAPARVELAPQHILDGPGVPPELRGRSVDQVMRIYGTLADAYLRRMPNQPPAAAGNPPTPAPHSPPQVPPQPRNTAGQFQPNQGWGEPQAPQQPDIRQIVREELQPFAANASSSAMQIARQQIPDFNELEAEVLQNLEGMPPQVLANPQAWVRAADLVRGQRMRQRFSPANQPGGNTGGNAPQNYAPAGGLSVPANSYGQPVHTFFSEAPTPPVFGQEYGLSASEQAAAAAFGMSADDYRAWKGGVNRR